MKVTFPYGKEKIEYDFEGKNLRRIVTSEIDSYNPLTDEETLVKEAMKRPFGGIGLDKMAEGKKKIVIIASDHTRPVPSRIIMPLMLSEIRKGEPNGEITILIATGCHRETTKQELAAKFGSDIVEKEKIVVHNCDDRDNLTDIGELPSGGRLIVNKIAAEADLLVSEGFIEPHFFAGFSGGRKSVLPGICGRETVMANHCSEFINDKNARTGILENNPINRDMVWAAEKINLKYIVNVVINSEKKILGAFAGEAKEAHRAGCEFLKSLCGVKRDEADVVITTNGGYPLDQNVYQAVKGMTGAEELVRQDGVIIMMAKSDDGMGGKHFYSQMADEEDINVTLAKFLSRGRNETEPDQWQSQIFIRVLKKARVIYISEIPDEEVRRMHMTPAHSIDEALEMACKMLKMNKPRIIAVPDGVSVAVR